MRLAALSIALLVAACLAPLPALADGEDDAPDPAPESTPEPQPTPPPTPTPPPPVPAPPAPAPVRSGPPAPKASLTLGGFAAFDWYQYFVEVGGLAPPGVQTAPAVAQVRVAPRLRAKYRFLRATAEVEFRHDFVDPGRGSRVIIREALVGLRTRGFRLEGGAVQARWGKMDVASPTDNLVAWDYEEFLFPEPLPIPGIVAGYARGVFAAEVIFSPAFTPSRYRHDAPSRWDNTWFLPQTQTVPTGIAGDMVFENRYEIFLDPELPGRPGNLANGWDLGGRVDLFLNAVDLGVSFAMTRDKLPSYTGFQVSNTNDLDGDGVGDHIFDRVAILEITPYHKRLLIPGIDFAVSAWRFVFKGEAAYFHTTDPKGQDCLVDDPYVRYAIGVELDLPELVGQFGLAIRVQYNGDLFVTSDERRQEQAADCPGRQHITVANPDTGMLPTDFESGFQGVPEIRHPYTHGWYWNVNLAFTRDFALDVRGFFDVAGDALVRAHLRYVLLDRVELSVGALAMLSTGDGTIFEPYGRNSRLEVGLAYRF